jgi:hypothetical protein
MVRAAYASGTPAIGIDSGNPPTRACIDADLERAATRIIASKSFDNRIICASEHNQVVEWQCATHSWRCWNVTAQRFCEVAQSGQASGMTSAHLRWRRDRVSYLSAPVNIQRVARLPVQQLLGADGLILAVGQVSHDVEDFEGEGE